MALFPIYTIFEEDFVVQLIPVDTEDTMDQVAEKTAYHVINRRVKPKEGKVLRVRHHETGELYPRDMKVSEAGWRPTETVEIIFADE